VLWTDPEELHEGRFPADGQTALQGDFGAVNSL
jgi:hypothetical protein